MRRTRLKPASTKKFAMLKRYWAAMRNDPDEIVCPHCRKSLPKEKMEPHHPFGRLGARLLLYVWICPEFHAWIHDNRKEATRIGAIMPEFDGRKSGPETPNYFKLPLP